MYRTVRHGENSLQYTILPQQDDLGSAGAPSGAGHAGRRMRKSGGGRLKLALVLGVALVLAAGAVTTAVLVPLMIPRPHGAGHRALTRHHHPPQNLLPARRPLHPSAEDLSPPPVAAAHLAAPAASSFSSTEDPSMSPISYASPAEDLAGSSAVYSEPPATEALTSTPPTPAATSTQATTTMSTSSTTTTTTTTTTPAPTTVASTVAATSSKGNADSTAGGGGVTESVVRLDGASNDTDGGGTDLADGDDADIDGPADSGRGRGSGKAGTWLETRWPFGDASAYFEWTGFNGEDSVLLPLALAGVVLVLVIFIAACYAIRRHRHKLNRRQAIGKMSNELQSGDKATLLPDGSEDE